MQIACEHVWKVFGAKRARTLRAGAPTDRLQAPDVPPGAVAAVRDVSFEVHKGEVFVVMGLSGSGKSTLIRALIRLVEITAGRVTVCGEDVASLDPRALRELRRHRISMVFQHFALFPHRRVIDNVAYGLEVQGVARAARLERARELLELVGLEDVGGFFPGQLSGGMQQRVGLARALAVDPEVLLFDEAFSALDPLIRREMQGEVIRLQQAMHKTIVFVTHDLDEALRLGDRIAIMRDGMFVQVGSPQDVVGAPANDYVADFTRDVVRGKVLTAGYVMRPAPPGPAPSDMTLVKASTLLQDVIGPLLADDRPLGVVDDSGAIVGSLDRATVFPIVLGVQPDPSVMTAPRHVER